MQVGHHSHANLHGQSMKQAKRNLPNRAMDRTVLISFSESLRPPSLSSNQFSLVRTSVVRCRLVLTNDSARTGTSIEPFEIIQKY